MNCPKCGAVLNAGATFCSSCGTNLAMSPMGAPPHMPPPGGMPYGMHPGMPPMPMAPPVIPRTSGMAIAGFILALLSCSLLGLIFSILGYNECKRSGGAVTGGGLATAGIIISIVWMVIGLAVFAGGSGSRY